MPRHSFVHSCWLAARNQPCKQVAALTPDGGGKPPLGVRSDYSFGIRLRTTECEALLTAARIGRSLAQLGVTSRSHSGSISSMFIVGGTIPRRIASMTAINSSEPLAPSA